MTPWHTRIDQTDIDWVVTALDEVGVAVTESRHEFTATMPGERPVTLRDYDDLVTLLEEFSEADTDAKREAVAADVASRTITRHHYYTPQIRSAA